MIIAAMLLYASHFQQAKQGDGQERRRRFTLAAEALNYYERKRTEMYADAAVPGVDCASQHRFLEYFAACVRELPGPPDPPRKAYLRSIKLLDVNPEIAPRLVVK